MAIGTSMGMGDGWNAQGAAGMALDGSCMDVADEAANAEYFGYPGASRGQNTFP